MPYAQYPAPVAYLPYQPYPQPAPGYQVAPKNAGIALLVSFFIPGVGSMMNGEAGKGAGILLGWMMGLLLTATLFFAIIGLPLCFGMWLLGLIDAYQGAQSWNRKHGVIS